MKIATWNINSIRARQERLLAWLDAHKPDALCLQETKVPDEDFPEDAIAEAGYVCSFHGQKSYNGVAILTKAQPQSVTKGFEDEGDESQSRAIAVSLGDVRIVCVYVPNGKTPGSESYAYKLRWLARLRAYLDASVESGKQLVLCGDFNVAPDDRDVYNPRIWKDEILCTDEERAALACVTEWGLGDVFRHLHEDPGHFTWWDYRKLGFQKNHGLRIDHVYVTNSMLDACTSAQVDREERKGKKPSDHAPVWVEFDMKA